MSITLSHAQLQRTISSAQIALLEQIGCFAARSSLSCLLVGGAVRDTLLGIPSDDVDVLIVGDAIGFAADVAQEIECAGFAVKSLSKFRKYGTAKLAFEDSGSKELVQIDFASARSEDYPVSGKPPVVTPGDLTSDLARRDFSINALAVHLVPNNFGLVEDLHRGLEDLSARHLRILHPQSFVDDPARLIRLIRFQRRLGFEVDSQTHRLFIEARDAGFLARLDPFRLCDEFRKAFCERDPESIISALDQAQLLSWVLPVECGFDATSVDLALIQRSGDTAFIDAQSYDYWKAVYALLCRNCSGEIFRQRIAEFGLSKRVALELTELHSYWRKGFAL